MPGVRDLHEAVTTVIPGPALVEVSPSSRPGRAPIMDPDDPLKESRPPLEGENLGRAAARDDELADKVVEESNDLEEAERRFEEGSAEHDLDRRPTDPVDEEQKREST